MLPGPRFQVFGQTLRSYLVIVDNLSDHFEYLSELRKIKIVVKGLIFN